MKPLTESPNLEPGRRGIMFESFAELGVLAAGLRHIASPEGAVMGLERPAAKLSEYIGPLTSGLQSVQTIADRSGHTFDVEVPIVNAGEVLLSELAVNAVAANEPGTTTHPELQDPLQHGAAIDMITEYRAATAALDNPQPPQPEA
jgi:hypothetical protein